MLLCVNEFTAAFNLPISCTWDHGWQGKIRKILIKARSLNFGHGRFEFEILFIITFSAISGLVVASQL